MSPRLSATLQVLMNGQLVGRLRSSAQGVLRFAYDPVWLSSENRRPISLSLPLAGREYAGGGVENFFDNLLPDSQPIRNRLQARVRGRLSPVLRFARPYRQGLCRCIAIASRRGRGRCADHQCHAGN